MKEALLIVAVLGVFAVVFFLMAKLDRFLAENRKAIEQESEKTEPSYIVLAGDLTEEELQKEIDRYREGHANIRILVYDPTQTDFSASTRRI